MPSSNCAGAPLPRLASATAGSGAGLTARTRHAGAGCSTAPSTPATQASTGHLLFSSQGGHRGMAKPLVRLTEQNGDRTGPPGSRTPAKTHGPAPSRGSTTAAILKNKKLKIALTNADGFFKGDCFKS